MAGPQAWLADLHTDLTPFRKDEEEQSLKRHMASGSHCPIKRVGE